MFGLPGASCIRVVRLAVFSALACASGSLIQARLDPGSYGPGKSPFVCSLDSGKMVDLPNAWRGVRRRIRTNSDPYAVPVLIGTWLRWPEFADNLSRR